MSARCSRLEVAAQWLERYFAAQGPALDRTAAILYLGASEGAFGLAGRTAAAAAARRWIAEETAGQEMFSEERLEPWTALLSRVGEPGKAARFPLLGEHARNKGEILVGAEWLDRLAGIRKLLENDLLYQNTSAPVMVKGSSGAFPGFPRLLAETMATHRADEALLRRDLRFSYLLVEADGNIAEAKKRLDAEWPLELRRITFSSLLASVVAGDTAASPAARRAAVVVAKPWLKAAAERIGRKAREAIPEKMEIAVGDWTGQTVSGDNVSELLADYGSHLDAPKKWTFETPSGTKWLDPATVLFGGAAVITGVGTAQTSVFAPLFVFCAFGAYLYWRIRKAELGTAAMQGVAEEKRSAGMSVIASTLSEASQYRRQVMVANREFSETLELLDSLVDDPADFPPGTPAPTNPPDLPAWELTPPAIDVGRRNEDMIVPPPAGERGQQ